MLESWKVENLTKGFVAIVRIFLIFNLVSLLWLLFQLPDIRHVGAYLQEIAACRSGNSPQIMFAVLFFGFPIVVYHFCGLLRPRFWMPFKRKHAQAATYLINGTYGMLLFLILVNSGSPGSFIYFQF
jgi:alginate O-acetyltransferase complex protein AlgI